jgi:hypothetical protein
MKLQIFTVLLTLCLTAVPLGVMAGQAPNEDNCRTAINAGLEQLKRIPPDITQRDDEDRKKLLADMERLVEANRRQGISECQTWTDLMKKAFNQ